MRILFLFLLTMIVAFLTKKMLDIDGLIYENFQNKLTNEQLLNYLNFKDKWDWLSYFIIPLILLIKTSLVSCVIYIGTFFFSKVKVTFKLIFNAVVKAEFVFIFVGIVKIIWFCFLRTNFNLEDIQYFYPLSALNIIGYKGLDTWLLYPLQTINLFEVAYIVYLSYQIGTLTKTNADTGLKIVGSSYIPALLLWVTIVMFFTLNFS